MVAEAIDITRETYFCILMDRESNGPVIIASPDGGVDIEEVAEKTPDRIKKMPVDIHTGVTDAMATEVAEFLGFTGPLVAQCAEQVKNLYKTFLTVDCLQLEINPLAETPQGQVSDILTFETVQFIHRYLSNPFFRFTQLMQSSDLMITPPSDRSTSSTWRIPPSPTPGRWRPQSIALTMSSWMGTSGAS